MNENEEGEGIIEMERRERIIMEGRGQRREKCQNLHKSVKG